VRLPSRLPLSTLPAGTALWRIHPRTHRPVWFGPAPGQPATHRFDAPDAEFRVCYLGDSLEAAFVETFIRGSGTRLVALRDLRARFATGLSLTREVRLARLHSEGLVRLGLSADVPHLHPYSDCQALALDLWRHADEVDGIEYRSRWDDSRHCVALFDRAADALGTFDSGIVLENASILRPVLKRYEVRIV
jgi:hypothetical protein